MPEAFGRRERCHSGHEPFDNDSMSDDVEFLRRVYALFTGRAIESVLAAMHPEVVWANGMAGDTSTDGSRIDTGRGGEVPIGMRTIGWVRTGEHDLDLADRARSQGLELAVLAQFTLRHSPPDELVLGFAGCAPAELRRGVDVLAAIVASNAPVHTAAPFRRVSNSNN